MEVIADRWPRGAHELPEPVLLTENGPALASDASYAIATPTVAALKIPPGVTFDTLIVDEASQMRLAHSAVIAALAHQIIVIGDTQQMVPRNLFTHVKQSQLPASMMRSLLDHAIASNIPSKLLKQHYRSKHESLILFSNRNFYEEQLDIIPSPVRDGSLGTEFRYVPNAVYARGSGTNLVEAQTLVSEALAIAIRNNSRRNNPRDGAPRSVGIITLNEDQRDLILMLLQEALAQNGLSELDFTGGVAREGLFVKALENVQGDERDIILVSTIYGYDQNQRFIANLGVLSQPGSDKRVNVLVTRSKWKTIIYHSFDIGRLADGNSSGANTFRNYWRATQADPMLWPIVDPVKAGTSGDELDMAFRLMHQKLEYSGRYLVHRFSRFIAGFDYYRPNRYIVAFYFTGLYSPLQEASDIARLKNAGWQVCRIAIEDWRTKSHDILKRLYGFIGSASVRAIVWGVQL